MPAHHLIPTAFCNRSTQVQAINMVDVKVLLTHSQYFACSLQPHLYSQNRLWDLQGTIQMIVWVWGRCRPSMQVSDGS